MKPLFTNCTACRNNPTHRTHQKALGARPAGAWHTCCDKHVPGIRMHTLSPKMRALLNPRGADAYHVIEAL